MIAPAPIATKSTSTGSASTATSSSTNAGSKRKASSSAGPNTAAGRKMARKTAHSLIERRRRSKINEEFGVLKDMIPACEDQEMHKLSILQASIEYMRYLEKCLADLKEVHSQCPGQASLGQDVASTRSNTATPLSQDTEMQELPPLRHAMSSVAPSSYTQLPSISPALLPLTRTSSTHPSPYHGAAAYPWANPTGSALPSPAFEPLARVISHTQPGNFKLTSPAMSPVQLPEDHEVTTALLMLNTDRRSWSEKDRDQRRALPRPVESFTSSASKRCSVRDLLQ